jgi:cytoskeletal protein CcmA (bactofilin family)
MREVPIFVLLLLSGVVLAAGDRVDRDAGGDRFSAGSSVSVSTPVTADLLAAGGNVEIDTRVGGDILAVGGDVRIKGEVESGVFAGAGQLRLNAQVKRSVRIAGGQVEVGPKAQLGGNLSIAGGQVRIEGPVFGYVQAAGGDITLDGPVGGDVWATGGRLSLGPNARIGGKLRYASSNELQKDPGAVVSGGVERIDFEATRSHAHKESQGSAAVAGSIWIAGLMVLAAVLVGVAPAFTARAAQVLKHRPWLALLIGFIVLACVPVAVVVLLVTVVGIPLALLLLLAYPILLLVGYELTAIGIGDLVMQRFVAGRAQSSVWRACAAAAAVLLVALLAQVPILGTLLAFLALLIGLGALVLQWRRGAPVA